MNNTLKSMGNVGWEKMSDMKYYPETCLDERIKAINTLRLGSQSGDYDSY